MFRVIFVSPKFYSVFKRVRMYFVGNFHSSENKLGNSLDLGVEMFGLLKETPTWAFLILEAPLIEKNFLNTDEPI